MLSKIIITTIVGREVSNKTTSKQTKCCHPRIERRYRRIPVAKPLNPTAANMLKTRKDANGYTEKTERCRNSSGRLSRRISRRLLAKKAQPSAARAALSFRQNHLTPSMAKGTPKGPLLCQHWSRKTSDSQADRTTLHQPYCPCGSTLFVKHRRRIQKRKKVARKKQILPRYDCVITSEDRALIQGQPALEIRVIIAKFFIILRHPISKRNDGETKSRRGQ